MVSQTPTEQVDLTEVTHEQVDPTEVTNDNVIDISILETVPDVIDIDKFTPPDLINIHEKVNKIVGHCRENGFSDNAVEVLRLLQAELVVGRNMEIASPDQCPEGATNLIMIDQQNILATAFEEIAGLENKHITLEVQFYNEVNSEVVVLTAKNGIDFNSYDSIFSTGILISGVSFFQRFTPAAFSISPPLYTHTFW